MDLKKLPMNMKTKSKRKPTIISGIMLTREFHID